ELRCAKLTSGGQPIPIGRGDDQDAPQLALHGDRRADSASGAPGREERRHRAWRALESLHASGTLRVKHPHAETRACDVETRYDRDGDAGDAPAADESRLPVRRIAEHGRQIAAKELPH